MSKPPRSAPPPSGDQISDPLHDLAALPARVRAMRAKILEAAKKDFDPSRMVATHS
jgi:hypothetical protein